MEEIKDVIKLVVNDAGLNEKDTAKVMNAFQVRNKEQTAHEIVRHYPTMQKMYDHAVKSGREDLVERLGNAMQNAMIWVQRNAPDVAKYASKAGKMGTAVGIAQEMLSSDDVVAAEPTQETPRVSPKDAVKEAEAYNERQAEKNSEKLKKGGIVPGNEKQYAGDTVPALLNKKEVVLNVEQQQRNLDHITGKSFPFPKGKRVDELLNSGEMSINSEAQNQLFDFIRGEAKEPPKQDILVYHKEGGGRLDSINANREQARVIQERLNAQKDQEISEMLNPIPSEVVQPPLSANSASPMTMPDRAVGREVPTPQQYPYVNNPLVAPLMPEAEKKDVVVNVNTDAPEEKIQLNEPQVPQAPQAQNARKEINKGVAAIAQDSINKQTVLKSMADLNRADRAAIDSSIQVGKAAAELNKQQIEQENNAKAIDDKYNMLQKKYDDILRSDYKVEGEQENPFENKSVMGKYFSSASIAEKILTGLVLAIAIPVSLATGKNPMLDYIMGSVDKDLEAQRLDGAEKSAKRTHMLQSLSGQLDLMKHKTNNEELRQNAEKLKQQLITNAEKNRIDWYNAESQRITANASKRKADVDVSEFRMKEQKMADPTFMDKDKNEQSNRLRDEYTKKVKDGGYDKLQAAVDLSEQLLSGKRSGAKDIAIMYNVVKGLDKDSAVREGEVEMTKEGQAIVDRFRNFADNITTGQLFEKGYQKELVDIVKMMAQVAAGQKKALMNSYSSLAKDYGIDPKFVLVDKPMKVSQTSDQNREANVKKIMEAERVSRKDAESALDRLQSKQEK